MHFLKKNTLTLQLAYGLRTLFLLYVFPLDAIKTRSTVLALTFSYGFITFGRRVAHVKYALYTQVNKLDDTWVSIRMHFYWNVFL